MFSACLLAALILTPCARSQADKEPSSQVPTPSGWVKETIPLPPAFAPDMKWKGSEELRFAPGMFKADAPDFFSYALLFRLPADSEIDVKAMEREMLAYYRGLAGAVLKSKKQGVDMKSFQLTITTARQPPEKRAGGEVVAGYVGELKWIEPFATGKPQTLRLEIHTWSTAKRDHHCVFVCASPQPETGAVWTTLREIRAGCTCR